MEADPKEKSENQAITEFKFNNYHIGCTIGSDTPNGALTNMAYMGVDTFQIVIDFNKDGSIQPISPRILSFISSDPKFRVIIHMPFYFHLFLDITPTREKYFRNLNNIDVPNSNGLLDVILHCKGKPAFNLKGNYSSIIPRYLKHYASIGDRLKLHIENDAGGKSNPAPSSRSIKQSISTLKSMGVDNVGFCFDTEHAYAAGDYVNGVSFNDDIDILHLNAIPHKVEFGGHLDRHSTTRLTENKLGPLNIKKILRSINPDTPIILERTDLEVMFDDIKYLRKVMK